MFEGLVDLADKVPGWVLIALTFFVGGGAGALIQAVRDVLLRWLDKAYAPPPEEDPYPLRPIEVLHDADQMYSALESLLAASRAVRVLLLRQENGGRLPVVGQKLTSSIDLEAHVESAPSTKMAWQAQALDPYYVRMLVEVDETGGVEKRNSTAQGILHNWLGRHVGSVAKVHFFPVFSTAGAFFYLSVEYTAVEGSPDIADAGYRDVVRETSARLSNILTRWYTGVPRG